MTPIPGSFATPLYAIVEPPYVEPTVLEDGSVMAGDFDHGTGTGTRTFLNGNQWSGQFVSWGLNGQGTSTSAVATFEGTFLNNRLHGQGKITSHGAAGSVQEGHFVHGRLHGQGKETCPFLGTVEEGNFVDGKLHGRGTITYADGRVDDGIFENGTLAFRKV